MPRCARCEEDKPPEAFHRRGAAGGRQAWCRSCRRAYDAAYHQRVRERRAAQKRALRAELLDLARRVKATTPCADCGGSFHPVAMHFDHPPGVEKVADVADMHKRYGRAALLAEIAKCDVVCANCHAVRTLRRSLGA